MIKTLAVGIITTNTLFSGDVQSSTANITTLMSFGTINATTINADIEGVAEGVKVQTVGLNSEYKFGLIPDHVTSGASAIFLIVKQILKIIYHIIHNQTDYQQMEEL